MLQRSRERGWGREEEGSRARQPALLPVATLLQIRAERRAVELSQRLRRAEHVEEGWGKRLWLRAVPTGGAGEQKDRQLLRLLQKLAL